MTVRRVFAEIGLRQRELHGAALAEQSEATVVWHHHHALPVTVDVGIEFVAVEPAGGHHRLVAYGDAETTALAAADLDHRHVVGDAVQHDRPGVYRPAG